MRFCAKCRTTLYWDFEMRPGLIGVACGAIEGKEALAPVAAAWTAHKAPWVTLPPGLPAFAQQTPASAID